MCLRTMEVRSELWSKIITNMVLEPGNDGEVWAGGGRPQNRKLELSLCAELLRMDRILPHRHIFKTESLRPVTENSNLRERSGPRVY